MKFFVTSANEAFNKPSFVEQTTNFLATPSVESQPIRFMPLICGVWMILAPTCWSQTVESRDLTQWGSDHVGQEIPDYMTGDECLFCHRTIGANWSQNPHQTTLRSAEPSDAAVKVLAQVAAETAGQVDFLLGSQRLVRYLRRSQGYGKLELLSARFSPLMKPGQDSTASRLTEADNLVWHVGTFGDRCAGCHATAVDSAERTFSATSLDCYVCHGVVVPEHTADTSRVLLSKQPQNPKVVNSVCGSCHLRGGISRSTSLPYPNTFVPGDNLFRDFQVDLSDSAIAELPPMQQHIYVSAREVGRGEAEPTCTNCHNVHNNHSQQHSDLPKTTICASCHVSTDNQRGTDPESNDDGQLLEAILQHVRKSERNATCDY